MGGGGGMRVLGIDPGTATTGYALVEGNGNRQRALAYGAIETRADVPAPERLQQIYRAVASLIRDLQPDVLAVEELFFNKNVRSALAVGQARGVILLAAADAAIPANEFTPLQVKQAVVGYGRAEKAQVQAMVKILLCLPAVPKPDDVADALAVAICCLQSTRYAQVVGGGRPGPSPGLKETGGKARTKAAHQEREET